MRAGDFRYGLERTFTVNAGYYLKSRPPLDAELYGAIVGVPKCLASPRSCHLNRGIVVDDKTGTITFHLRHPDPDFLAKLALPLAVAVPPEAPRHDSGLHPLPATGPYMVTRYALLRAVLVRNPFFHEWSHDAQPDGYPDRIVWRVYKKTSQAVSAVEHGTADWLYFTYDPISTQQIHEIETDYVAQTHPAAYSSISGLTIKPNSPLGRDRTARRAIAYAIDRVKLEGGGTSFPVRRTCQVIPRNFPGYRPYCPYKLDPAHAQKLVRRSPSYGKPVSVFSDFGTTSGRYLVDLLNSLGYRARLLPADENGEPTEDPDVRMFVWASDYVGASDFILQIQPGVITPSDLRAVYEKQGESQYKGMLAWAAADKHVTNDARIIPFGGVDSSLGFTSKRVGNYQFAPAPGNAPIVDQMWVR